MNKTPTTNERVIDPSQLPKDSALSTAIRLTSRYFYVAYSKLMSLRWEWTDVTPFGATDGERLLLNPKGIAALEKQDKGVNLIAFLLVHEALHALLGHSWRLRKLPNHQKANIAADYVINFLIKQQNKKIGRDIFLLIDGCLINDQLDPSWSAEKLYRQLPDDEQQQPQPDPQQCNSDDSEDSDEEDDTPCDLNPESGDDSDDSDSGSTDQDDQSSDGDDESDDSEGSSPSDSEGDQDGDDDGDDSDGSGGANDPTDGNGDVDFSKFPGTGASDLMEPELDGRTEDEFVEQQETINERVMIADQIDRQQMSDTGSVGVRISQQRQEFSGIDWYNRLSEWLMKRSRNGWNSPMNVSEYITTGLISAGRRGKRCGDIVFVLDSSGSIGEATYSRFLDAGRQCLDELEPENIHILSVSHMVCDAVTLQAGDTVPDSLKGGGGTRFQPAFDWVQDNVDDPDVLVYLTDGYAGDRLTIQPVDYPVLWLSTGCCIGDYPFGEVMEIINA